MTGDPVTTDSPTITTRGLSKSYGKRPAVANLDLEVHEGSVFGFIGPNGAGKTTTIRLLLGFLSPGAGEARIFGRDCWRDSHHIKADVGYVPGDLRLHSWLTGHSALRIARLARGRELTRRGHELAELLELDLDVVVRNMSQGMRQKLGLILALAHEPRLLVFDEPTSALDPVMQDRLYRVLRDHASAGNTVFFSSHVLSEVEGLCDRVAVIRHGELVANETLDTLRAQAKRAVTIHWGSTAPPTPPAFLELEEQRGSMCEYALEGTAAQLLDWLRGHDIDDFAVGEPDLDRLFKRYYEGEEERS